MRISDRTLQRWLRTGRPGRVERHLDDPEVVDRLEALTVLNAEDVAALDDLTKPGAGFEERVARGISSRSDGEAVGLFFDLLGLGWHTAAAILENPDEVS